MKEQPQRKKQPRKQPHKNPQGHPKKQNKPKKTRRPWGFITAVILLVLVIVLLVLRPWNKDLSMALNLSSEDGIVEYKGRLAVEHEGQISLYDKGKLRFQIATDQKPIHLALDEKYLYVAQNQTLQKLNAKGEVVRQEEFTEPIVGLHFEKELYALFDHEVIRFNGDNLIHFPVQGYVVDCSADDHTLWIIHLKEEEDHRIKSQLSVFNKDGQLNYSFSFMDEIMEAVYPGTDEEYYLLSDKNFYRFKDMSMLDKKPLSRLEAVGVEDGHLYYLDYKKLVRVNFENKGISEHYLTEIYHHIVPSEQDTLLYTPEKYLLIRAGEQDIAGTATETILSGFSYHKDLYLVTESGVKKINAK